ncbi:hypothetical protein Fot_40850 [Forsythia ovata]|uniref:Uncharacterized protein n=1 Tax=Forsythia ovata TaxID=205694 RepID=A0ABD1RGT4_9LAMI
MILGLLFHYVEYPSLVANGTFAAIALSFTHTMFDQRRKKNQHWCIFSTIRFDVIFLLDPLTVKKAREVLESPFAAKKTSSLCVSKLLKEHESGLSTVRRALFSTLCEFHVNKKQKQQEFIVAYVQDRSFSYFDVEVESFKFSNTTSSTSR